MKKKNKNRDKMPDKKELAKGRMPRGSYETKNGIMSFVPE